jgi:sulfur-oxidizing protein SoxA
MRLPRLRRAPADRVALVAPVKFAYVVAVMAVVAVVAGIGPAAAQPADAPDPRRSGLDFMSPALQALQRDDRQNPALLWVQDGAALWRAPAGAAAKSCAGCHGAAEQAMRGVAARYPAWDDASGQALNLAGRINSCRQRHQQALPLAADDADALALAAYIGLQSRGLPVAPPADARLAPLRGQGGALWQQRLGQLNLACRHCHDQYAGQRLGGAAIPQAHATGYPTYRLEWQGLGSLQRRLRGCVVGVRAEPFAADAPEWLALEAWLATRAAGLPVETPAVRP